MAGNVARPSVAVAGLGPHGVEVLAQEPFTLDITALADERGPQLPTDQPMPGAARRPPSGFRGRWPPLNRIDGREHGLEKPGDLLGLRGLRLRVIEGSFETNRVRRRQQGDEYQQRCGDADACPMPLDKLAGAVARRRRAGLNGKAFQMAAEVGSEGIRRSVPALWLLGERLQHDGIEVAAQGPLPPDRGDRARPRGFRLSDEAVRPSAS